MSGSCKHKALRKKGSCAALRLCWWLSLGWSGQVLQIQTCGMCWAHRDLGSAHGRALVEVLLLHGMQAGLGGGGSKLISSHPCHGAPSPGPGCSKPIQTGCRGQRQQGWSLPPFQAPSPWIRVSPAAQPQGREVWGLLWIPPSCPASPVSAELPPATALLFSTPCVSARVQRLEGLWGLNKSTLPYGHQPWQSHPGTSRAP